MRTAVALVAVVLLAGCSFLGGGPGSPTATTPTGGNGIGPAERGFPPGYGDSGVTNVTAALDANTGQLLSAGSFYLEYNGTAVSGDRTATGTSAQIVNISQDRAYVITRFSQRPTTVQYYTGGRVYIRTDPSGENNTEYSSREATVSPGANPQNFTGRQLYGNLLEHVEWGNVTRADNGSLLLYRAQSLKRAKPVLGSSVDRSNVTDFRGTLLVGSDGTIYRVAYGATVERKTASDVGVAITTRKVGNTTVQEPTWLEKARS